MNIIVFQHHDAEHPGIFRDFMTARGLAWHPVNLHHGDTIPDLADFDVMMVMGGPMDVWDTDEHPWLIREKTAIRQWVMEAGKPYLGVCLGHQLLADSCGGTCGKLQPAEVGICGVSLKPAGVADPLMHGIPADIRALQWHGVQVEVLPEGGVSLAQSDVSDNQAIRVGNHAWGIQYHVELTDTTVAEWGEIPEYKAALDNALGPDALPGFVAEADANMADFQRNAEQMFDNFVDAISA